jgi:hypothetical protein
MHGRYGNMQGIQFYPLRKLKRLNKLPGKLLCFIRILEHGNPIQDRDSFLRRLGITRAALLMNGRRNEQVERFTMAIPPIVRDLLMSRRYQIAARS